MLSVNRYSRQYALDAHFTHRARGLEQKETG